jgi:hypothetical protein
LRIFMENPQQLRKPLLTGCNAKGIPTEPPPTRT